MSVDDAYRTLIASDRVSTNTRRALLERAAPDDAAYEPRAISAFALFTLRALVDRVIPQDGSVRIDLAARIDRQLQSGEGDGWRFAALPADAEAYRAGLATLDDAAERQFAAAFAKLEPARQDAMLRRIAAGDGAFAGDVPVPAGRLDSAQMRAWFEDVRADAVKLYVAHPATLARMGYSGIANGGDGMPKSGFARVGPGEREAWEPIAARDVDE